MQFPSSHNIEEQLKSLSERLRYLASDKNSYNNYNDTNIKSENLKFNLAFVISHIILNLNFVTRDKDTFLKTIEEYNQANTTSLTFDDFEKINWIRIIAGEVVLPELVRHFIWKVGHYETEGKPIVIPEDKKDLIRCLQIYYNKSFNDSKLSISLEKLNEIIRTKGSALLSIKFFEERDIIGYDSVNGYFYWKDNEYIRHLRNEIASTLWLFVGGEESTEVEFRKYFKLIRGTKIWVDNLRAYLSKQNIDKISESAISFLNSEDDLLKSSSEFNKIWLDANAYQHIDIKTEIPSIEFNYETPFDFIESVNYHKWRIYDAFDYQKTRSFCFLLLRLIIKNDANYPTPYQDILRIFRDTSRPFLIWTLYQDIPKQFAEVIPYLLTDSELNPIAFKQIDKIEIDNVLIPEQSNIDRRLEAGFELKNELWLQMFDLTLEELVSVHNLEKEQAEIIPKILLEIANKVFSLNTNDRNSSIHHISIRKRYDDTLQKLGNKRITSTYTYPRPLINPRLIFYLFPYVFNYLKERFTKRNLSHTEYLNLNCALIDVGIEILKLANLRISKTEISDEQQEAIKDVSRELILLLESFLVDYYTATEIIVQVYPSGTDKKSARRWMSEFGFEIIDWGYLYLHFQKNNLLKKFNQSFSTSLNFKTDSNKYDEQNKDQFEKLKYYVKSLLLAFISINQKKDTYEIDGLPVKETLDELESLIKKYSITYSIDEISESRIDIFNERFSVFGNNMYYQPLTSLLYRSINLFKHKGINEFVEDFFSKTLDIGRLLSAINILDSKELKNLISSRISDIKIEDFIKTSSTTTELEHAIIEAVDSEKHWELAKPLIERIQKHFQKVKYNDERNNIFLLEINLLLAFKEKDFSKLSNVPVPPMKDIYPTANKRAENLKSFFIALFKLYNDKNYDEAIKILRTLLSEETKNIRYAFHIYQAETLKAIETNE
ncbi:MAG: hypothetical protein JWN83_2591 [Chitinophagaceae bacterium]|nr:hypothetical protein [Chitinophagaceae bacterium]